MITERIVFKIDSFIWLLISESDLSEKPTCSEADPAEKPACSPTSQPERQKDKWREFLGDENGMGTK